MYWGLGLLAIKQPILVFTCDGIWETEQSLIKCGCHAAYPQVFRIQHR